MRSIAVGLFNDNELGRMLGKKGSETDMVLFNRKDADVIYTFMQPVEGKLAAKSQIMSVIDAAVVSFENMSTELGETILLLNAAGIAKGVAVATPGTDVKQIVSMTRGTSLESFTVRDRNEHYILHTLSGIATERDTKSPSSVVVDQSFSVRGVGEVVLGFVRSGIVRRHDKMTLLPANKEVTIRSIQMHDKDFDEAPAGSRVGLAIKGATIEEMRRGSVLTMPGIYETGETVTLSFRANKFYSGGIRQGSFHATVGMQTFPAVIASVSGTTLTLHADRPIVFRKDDTFLLLDLNAPKVHFMGSGIQT